MDERRGVGRSHTVGRAKVGTGELAHEWAHELREVVADLEGIDGRPLVLVVDEPLTPHGQRLMDAFGVRVEVKPVTVVDAQEATESRDCPQPGCTFEAEAGRTHCRHHRRLGEPLVLESRRLHDRPAVAPPVSPPSAREEPPGPAADGAKGWSRRPKTREQAIEAIQRFANNHGRAPVRADFLGHADEYISPNTVGRLFGSWSEGIVAAGFVRPTHIRRDTWTREAAITRMHAIIAELGRVPTCTERVGLPGTGAYTRLFGSWSAYLEAALEARAVGPVAGPSAPARASSAEPDAAPPVSENHDPLNVGDLSAGELVACGKIMQTVGSVGRGLEPAERRRVGLFIAALLEEAASS